MPVCISNTDATIHDAVPAGERLRVDGVVTARYEKRGRDYVHMEIKLRRAADDRLLITYRDTVILSYSGAKGASA